MLESQNISHLSLSLSLSISIDRNSHYIGKHQVVGAEMASGMSFGQIKELVKVSLGVAGLFALGAYFFPDTRTEWYKEFQAKQFECEAEKAIAAYRGRKREANGQK
ncbi:hypothetical protein POM88_053953 [Heracleum sosnowskyi]|uniref:Uncharacterized protein n=1 Tax=Heracleum sosnowskyi TaxID=360622 RepID=A0AAD8LX43_9APIA|nr:hypothetical protein POM88_053953 [Heracleum sosnowskyi]